MGDDLGQAGAGERLADRVADLERRVAVRRHRRVRAGCPGSARSPGRGRPPRRRRPRSRCRGARSGRSRRAPRRRRQATLERLRAGRDGIDRARRRGLRLDADAGQQVALLVGGNVGARAGGSRVPAGTRLAPAPARSGAVSTLPVATVPPAHSAMSRAVRSAPSRASRNSWPFSNRRLASERRRVALAGPADADRIEDRRLDDHVRRRVPHLRRRVAHDAGDPERPVRIGDDERVGVERRARRGRASRSARRPPLAGR